MKNNGKLNYDAVPSDIIKSRNIAVFVQREFPGATNGTINQETIYPVLKQRKSFRVGICRFYFNCGSINGRCAENSE